jgi:hypothetical protein
MSLSALAKLIVKWRKQIDEAGSPEEAREMLEVGSQNIASEFGYPVEVTPKMLTGELPMDSASRRAREIEQGFTENPLMYRGHGKDYPPNGNKDMFMSDDYDVAETYAIANNNGDVTPLRHNADNLLEIDAEGMLWEDLDLEPYHVPDLNFGTYMGEINGTEAIGEAVKEEGKRQGVRFKNLIDDYSPDDLSASSTVDNVLGSRPEVKIRHAEMAAYDPDYLGPNIMGNATVPMMGLLASGTAGAGVLLNSLFAEAERAKK